MLRVDLNCDMGEGMANDSMLMPYISSANIACGFHAGDDETMRKTIQLCQQHQVAVGAHPSYFDRENFGRSEMNLSSEGIFKLITDQLVTFGNHCRSFGVKMHHVKPHGALYNQAAKDERISDAIIAAIVAYDRSLILYGLSGSVMISTAKKAGLQVASEVFADRGYTSAGKLQPRNLPGALISDESSALKQVIEMVEKQRVTAITGEVVPITAETICIHGDGVNAVAFAKNISAHLMQKNIAVETIRLHQ